MDIVGRHLVPAPPSRLREALVDRATVEACLPPAVALGPPSEVEGGRQLSFPLSSRSSGAADWSGRLDMAFAEEAAFTAVSWRWLADEGSDAPDGDALTRTIDRFLERIGQHASVPVTVAAEGLSGVAATVAETVPDARDTPFGPLLARARSWPPDLAIGGALFAVVVLIVAGSL